MFDLYSPVTLTQCDFESLRRVQKVCTQKHELTFLWRLLKSPPPNRFSNAEIKWEKFERKPTAKMCQWTQLCRSERKLCARQFWGSGDRDFFSVCVTSDARKHLLAYRPVKVNQKVKAWFKPLAYKQRLPPVTLDFTSLVTDKIKRNHKEKSGESFWGQNGFSSFGPQQLATKWRFRYRWKRLFYRK